MIFYQYDSKGGQHVCDLTDMFHGRPAFLVGGAPSLKEQNYKLLEQRGILTFAINNTGCLFRPTCMISCDTPKCFDPRLLKDPTIMKFAWNTFFNDPIYDQGPKYMSLQNQFFFDVLKRNKDSRMLQWYSQIPWKNNSLFAAICIVKHLGITRLYLAGSDFGPNKDGQHYSVGANLDDKEKIWNDMLYKAQVRDLIKLKPVFDDFDFHITDTSKYTKLSSVYPTSTIEDAVSSCLLDFPQTFAGSLPHVSRLFPGMADKVASSQYNIVDEKEVLKDNS